MRGVLSRALYRAILAAAMCSGLAACATTGTSSFQEKQRLFLPKAGERAMTLGAAVDPPTGFVRLCVRSPIDCVQADTPQARAHAVLEAQAISKARWQRVIDLALNHGVVEPMPPAPASVAAPASAAPIPVVALAPAPAAPASAADAPITDALPAAAPPPVLTPASQASPAGDARIPLDETTWAKLVRINTYVNRAIRPVSDDRRLYGASDWWVAPLSSGLAPYGDCKDYVLEKRRELIGEGVPAKALSIALVRTAWGELHAVLVATTQDGDFVLDNLAFDIRRWDLTPYAWESRQSADDPLVWLAVVDRAAPPRRSLVALADTSRPALR